MRRSSSESRDSPFDSDNKQYVRSHMNSNWPARQPSPTQYPTPHMSQYGLGPNPHEFGVRPMSFTHNMSLQRAFTPRTSYPNAHNSMAPNPYFINQQNHSPGYQMRAQSPMPSGYDSIDATHDYRQQSHTPNQLYHNRVDQPIYSTPNVINDISIEALRSAIHGIDPNNLGPKSPDDTVSSGSCSHYSMTELIQKLKVLNDKEMETKKQRKQIEEKLKEIDEQMKAYEKKLQLRDQLMKLKEEYESTENQFDVEKQQILTLMEITERNESNASNYSIKSDVSATPSQSSKVNVSKEIVKKLNFDKLTDRSAVKRPTGYASSKSIPVKKIRVEVRPKAISSTLDKEISKLSKSIPKANEKTIAKPSSTSRIIAKPDAGQSPKINRPCRQPLLQSSSVTSGVKTSRPQKLMTSRSKTHINENTAQQKESTEKSIEGSESSDSSKSKSDFEPKSDTQLNPTIELNSESDNEVFSELLFQEEKDTERVQTKSISDTSLSSNDNTNEQLTQRLNSDQSESSVKSVNVINTEGTDSQTNMEIDNSTKPDNESNKETNDSNEKEKGIELETHLNIDHNYTNPDCDKPVDKEIELIELDDDVDDYSIAPDLGLVKNERNDENVTDIEASNCGENINPNQINESDREIESNPETNAKTLCQSTATVSDDSEKQSINSNKEQNNDSKEGKVKKQKYKFTGFEAESYPPDKPYTNTQWKAIAGPKSQTSKTMVTYLTTFKNYLIVTFLDCSVRRYDIDDRNNVLKYEGHDGWVLNAIHIMENPFKSDSFVLLTGCYDSKVRCFDVMNGNLINSIDIKEEVYCLEYCYSHVFVGTNSGNLIKISLTHKSDTDSLEMNVVDKFTINNGRKVYSIKGVNALKVDSDSDFEAILVATNNKIRVIDTKVLVKDEDRILVSTSFSFLRPILMQTYKHFLCLSYKMPPIKSEDKKSIITNSKLLFFDMQKNWKPIREIPFKDTHISSLELNNNSLICCTYSGEIKCIDIDSLTLKWFAYHRNKLTTSVMINDRLVVGTEEGLIDVIYLDGKRIECDKCGICCARQVDLKHHIKNEHPVEELPESDS